VWFGVITLFPEMFQMLNTGITGRAIKDKRLNIDFWNPRDYSTDKHKTVDDHPYGGGPGMLMMAPPLQAAIHAAKKACPQEPTVIYLSPQGRIFDQEAAAELASKQALILVNGRYEGLDERIIQTEIDEEWSIGDYILTGGELGSMVMIDAITRLIPGCVGDANSVLEDSLTSGLLKYPQYTRPESHNGATVPNILLKGNHREINRWRLKESLGKTWLKRPDLLAKKMLTEQEVSLLAEFIEEFLMKQSKID
jgi:tRNA (guanine37-N1)-methyltransferase